MTMHDAVSPRLAMSSRLALPLQGQHRLIVELESTGADYEEHQQQLFVKLVSILEERREMHTRDLKA